MGRVVSVLFAAFVFYVAYIMIQRSPAEPAHIAVVAGVIGFGVLVLFLPDLFRRLFNKLDDRRVAGNMAAATRDSPTNDWRDGENFIPSSAAVVGAWLIALACLSPIAYCWKWYADGQAGPQAIDNQVLADVKNLDAMPTRYITVKADKVFDPNLTAVIKKGKLNIEKAKFYLLQVDDQFLIARCPINELKNFSGYLMPRSGNWFHDVDNDIHAKIRLKYPKVESYIMPYELTCGSDGNILYWFYILAGISGFISGGFAVIAVSVSMTRRAKLAARSAEVPVFSSMPSSLASVVSANSELGQQVSTHRSDGSIIATLFFGMVGLGLAGASAYWAWEIVGDGTEKALLWLSGMGGLFSVLALSMAYLSKRPPVAVALHAHGMQIDDTSFRWSDVADVTEVVGMVTRWWKFDLVDGRQVQFHDRISNYDRFQMNWGRTGFPELVMNRIERIDGGEAVQIGLFTITRDGFTCGGKSISWTEIASAQFHIYPRHHQKFLKVELRGKFFTWKSPNLWHTPSTAILHEVLTRIAPATIWPRR